MKNRSGSISEQRALGDKERELLQRLLKTGTEEAHSYLKQLPETMVAGRCACGCPTLELSVGKKSASLGSPTTVLAEASGISPEGVRFAIILHAREGLLSELEVFPIDGNDKFTLPDVERVRIDPA